MAFENGYHLGRRHGVEDTVRRAKKEAEQLCLSQKGSALVVVPYAPFAAFLDKLLREAQIFDPKRPAAERSET